MRQNKGIFIAIKFLFKVFSGTHIISMIRGEERRIVNDLELKKAVLYCR